jgi:hypothetical protein
MLSLAHYPPLLIVSSRLVGVVFFFGSMSILEGKSNDALDRIQKV